MQSLRTRKPSSASRQKSQRQPSRLQRLDSTSKDARKSRVDDKIKKRMSTRYADISAPTAQAIPAVPALPIGAMRTASPERIDEEVMERTVPREDPRVAEIKLLDNDKFDPDAYLKVKLANSTEAELKSLQSSLRSSKDDVATDLQRNVFKNYAEFVLVSKEISVLENEMLELKEGLMEWKGMPSLLHVDDSASAADRRRNVRSSIADLRVLYANQMQTLHAQIEGSTKFVPTTPGRHIVTEMEGILALNAATYKVERTVKFVVLDDAVLVARRRKRKGGDGTVGGDGGGKLVAERCWPLNEMLVLDTKDTATMTNVFKIRHGRETHVYRTELPSEKRSILSTFRQAAEELASKRRKEREGEHERRKSMWIGGDRGSLAVLNDKMPTGAEWIADLARQAGVIPMGSSEKEKTERDARWVGDFTDELTVAIALREWDRAVELVEQGEAKVSITPLLASKLPALTNTLSTSLLHDLSSPNLRKSQVVHLITLLNRLHAGPAARATFLAARNEVMRKRIRTIRFEGHVGVYVNDLAIVVFTGIKHTADWFLASFKENEVASSFVDWARKQIETYADMFRKQVYTTDVDSQTVEEALQITYSQSKRLLEEFGLDFRFLLNDLLLDDKPKNRSPRPFSSHSHAHLRPELTRTPSSTPYQGRSPQSSSGASTPRVRSPSISAPVPVPAVPPVSVTVPTPTTSTTRIRSPSQSVSRAAIAGGILGVAERPPRSLRGSPAPPPRSRDRPGSSASLSRPTPVAPPRSEGMF